MLIQNENGGLFFAILPCGNVRAPWQQAFRDTMKARNFTIRFMYGVEKSSYVYIVFGLCAEQRLNISSAGVGKALGKVFTKRHEKSSFISIVCLSSVNCNGGETWLALAIAHVACSRCAFRGGIGEFDTTKGDVGDSRVAFAVDYIRATSFPHALCGSLTGIVPEDAAARHDQITAELRAKNLPLPWGKSKTKWSAKLKTANVVSALFQASQKILDLLLRELAAYATTQHARLIMSTVEDKDTSGICLHAVFKFQTPIEPTKKFLAGCIEITKRLTMCTALSLAPLELVEGNLFACAAKASLDSDPSPIRDEMWAKYFPFPEPKQSPHKPHPPPPRQQPPPKPCSMEPLPPPPQMVPVKRGPAPQDPRLMSGGPSAKKAKVAQKEEEVVQARPMTRYLESQISEVVFEHGPGTEGYDQDADQLIKYVHEWFFEILDIEPESVPVHKDGIARVTLSNSTLFCLQLLADNMRRCGKAIYHASLSFKLAVTKMRNTIAEIHDDFNQAHEICRGLEPVINAFRFTAVDTSKDFEGIGAKHAPESCCVFVPLELPKPLLPEAIANMNEFNLVKRIYMDMQRAHDKLYEMRPNDGLLLVDWDKICRNVGELKDILHEGPSAARRCWISCAWRA